MSLLPKTDLTNHVKVAPACGQATAAGVAVVLTAAATEDNVKVTGQSIDRMGYQSCVLSLGCIATLAASETIAFAVEYQDSDDNSTWNTAVALQASTVLLTDSGSGSNLHGSLEIALSLKARARYIRFNVTPNMSASGTDTAVWYANAILAGPQKLPAA